MTDVTLDSKTAAVTLNAINDAIRRGDLPPAPQHPPTDRDGDPLPPGLVQIMRRLPNPTEAVNRLVDPQTGEILAEHEANEDDHEPAPARYRQLAHPLLTAGLGRQIPYQVSETIVRQLTIYAPDVAAAAAMFDKEVDDNTPIIKRTLAVARLKE